MGKRKRTGRAFRLSEAMDALTLATAGEVDDEPIAEACETAGEEVTALQEELQEWYDNLPENFQNGSKGEALQEAISALGEVVSALENREVDDAVSAAESVEFPGMYG